MPLILPSEKDSFQDQLGSVFINTCNSKKDRFNFQQSNRNLSIINSPMNNGFDMSINPMNLDYHLRSPYPNQVSLSIMGDDLLDSIRKGPIPSNSYFMDGKFFSRNTYEDSNNNFGGEIQFLPSCTKNPFYNRRVQTPKPDSFRKSHFSFTDSRIGSLIKKDEPGNYFFRHPVLPPLETLKKSSDLIFGNNSISHDFHRRNSHLKEEPPQELNIIQGFINNIEKKATIFHHLEYTMFRPEYDLKQSLKNIFTNDQSNILFKEQSKWLVN